MKTIGVSLSGGGYRATLFAVGALAALYDSGYWSGVRWIASVSGGSFASAAAALLPLDPSPDDMDAYVGRAIAVASRRLSLAGRPIHGAGIGAAFEAGVESAWLSGGAGAQPTLSSIQRDDRLHAFMAVDLHSLEPVALTDRIIHTVGGEDEDHVAHDPGPLRLATAVRASASVPLLPAVRVRPTDLGPGGDFPLVRDLFLGDGGNWNNLGTNWEKIAQWLDRRHGFLPAAIPERVDLHLARTFQ
jgi:NTE family protein